jgi:hypothetical protein
VRLATMHHAPWQRLGNGTTGGIDLQQSGEQNTESQIAQSGGTPPRALSLRELRDSVFLSRRHTASGNAWLATSPQGRSFEKSIVKERSRNDGNG